MFECTMVEYLGLVLSEGRMEMDPIKIARVRNWLTPKNVTEVQSFMGFVNFYCRFIPEFSHVATPLHHLTKKAEPWHWTKPEEAAFQVLKSLVTSALVPILPGQDACFQLETDTSGYATGAMMRNGTPSALRLRVSAQLSAIMPSMKRSCYWSYAGSKSGDIYWKGLNT